jgi:hypothetical protein
MIIFQKFTIECQEKKRHLACRGITSQRHSSPANCPLQRKPNNSKIKDPPTKGIEGRRTAAVPVKTAYSGLVDEGIGLERPPEEGMGLWKGVAEVHVEGCVGVGS